ncbi:MAG: hypothetical protein Q9174_005104, partial [Haloplaca sp. 1 TL-2023]
MAAMAEVIADVPSVEVNIKTEEKPTLTPPASEGTDQHYDSGSELSELEAETVEKPDEKETFDEEIEPDHYYEGGNIPVFKPTMDQFRSFKTFISKIDKYGMKSGIVKVIPPQEWLDGLPALDEAVKTIKVKNPITQEFHGTHGTYTQANIEKQRTYNLPQWKALTDESNHQPPARRGERRRNQETATRAASTRSARVAAKGAPSADSTSTPPPKRSVGRPRVRPLPTTVHKTEKDAADQGVSNLQVPPTPTSPPSKPIKVKKEAGSDDERKTKGKGRQPKSVASRRQHNRRDQNEAVDEEAFKDFDYRIHNQSEWTAERCSELETAYWKSLTFNNPMYGADMPGSLFEDSTTEWNVAKLENLLDVLGQKVPGVNTAYLYLGMWKASFAWHLEDVDLYSINYIHFGAPKQWYSISQEDARRFEAAMRAVWPNDAKNCDQFLRHKTYLISPQLLQSQYNIRVNRLVHHENEFVITFPYGYHSGYNLGYNCAESVNFATESWLDYGKVAKKCHCEADSVWVDVFDIERKLRGEPTPEYYEETDDDEEEEEDEGPTDLPTPPGSVKGKPKARSNKRKRDAADKDGKKKVKKLRIRLKAPAFEPCILCPNDYKFETLLPTDSGQNAHRSCGLHTPETWISDDNGSEKVCGIDRIDKARFDLRCNFCRSKKGAVFQCSQLKCTRAYHATCAIAAAVQIDMGEIPIYGEDGTEYKTTGFDYRCKIHRSKRFKNMDSLALEEDAWIRSQAPKIHEKALVQVQYEQGDIFGGVVLENRRSEQTLLVEVLPKGDKVEVEYKWLLIFDPVNSHLPAPSANAKPLPKHLAEKSRDATDDSSNETPKAGQAFSDPNSVHVWSEFHTCRAIRNAAQTRIDLSKTKQLWFYLGKGSTETKAQFTGDLTKPFNDHAANFLDSVRPPPPPYVAPQPIQRRSFPATYPAGVNMHAANAAGVSKQYQQKPLPKPPVIKERPYTGKYYVPDPKPYQYKPKDNYAPETVSSLNKRPSYQKPSTQPPPIYNNVPAYRAPPAPMAPMAQMMPTPPKPALQQYNNKPVDYRRPSNEMSSTSRPVSQGHAQQASKPQAPVANMLASNPTPKTASPPIRPPSVKVPVNPNRFTVSRDGRRGVSKLNVPTQWRYLHQAEKERPKLYQSPYPPVESAAMFGQSPGGASPSTEVSKPRSSELWMMQRTPSQQEQVRGHIRKTSDAKDKMQKEKIRQQQEQLQLLTRKRQESEQQSRRNSLSHNPMHINTMHQYPYSMQQHRHHSPPQSYNDMASTYNQSYQPYPDSFLSTSHAHSPTNYSNPYQSSYASNHHPLP